MASTGGGSLSVALTSPMVLAVADVVSVAGAVGAAASLLHMSLGSRQAVACGLMLAVMVPLAVGLNFCLGLYDVAGRGPIERFRLRALAGVWLPVASIAVVALHGPFGGRHLAVILLASLMAFPAALIGEALVRDGMIRRRQWGHQAVLIGEPASVATVAAHLQAHPYLGLRPIGFYSSAPPASGSRGLPWLGTLRDVERAGNGPQVAVVTDQHLQDWLRPLRLPYRRVIFLPGVSDVPSLGVRTCDLGGLLGLRFSNSQTGGVPRPVWHLVERLVALLLLVPSVPLLALAAIAVWFTDNGPVIYVQPRVGLHGKPVSVFKLRSMYLDAEQRLCTLLESDAAARAEWERFVKLKQDPRVLRLVGRFIRRTSIDELPQLWNVVRGDIRLVGPRPFPSYHTSRFPPEFQRLRATVKPGLTGLWQVSNRSDADLEQQTMLDSYYIYNRSIWLDLYILAYTLPATLLARGAR